jgi:hypothetical protein
MSRRHGARLLLAALALTPQAQAGAWPQEPGHGFAINQSGYGFTEDDRTRLLFDTYAEAGLGHGLTAVFAFDGDLSPDISQYVWRAGAGIRASFDTDLAPGWLFSAEATLRYQGHQSLIVDPVFAGDGIGYGARLDAGRSLSLFDLTGFVNLSAGWVHRAQAPAEIKLEAVAGLDLSDTWQTGLGYFGSRADGAFFDPGAYEKHEAQAWLRWRIDADYALALSLAQTIAVDRVPHETTVRLALWTFFYPEVEDGGD